MLVSSGDLLENYAALWIAIEYGIDNSDMAFKLLDKAIEDPFCKNNKTKRIFNGEIKASIRRTDLNDEDIENMINLREQKVSYKDIGLMYGLTHKAIFQRIKNYKVKEKSMSIKKINNYFADTIIETREPRGLFYTINEDKEKKVYVGIDNSYGDAWTEDFKNLEACKRWLVGGKKSEQKC